MFSSTACTGSPTAERRIVVLVQHDAVDAEFVGQDAAFQVFVVQATAGNGVEMLVGEHQRGGAKLQTVPDASLPVTIATSSPGAAAEPGRTIPHAPDVFHSRCRPTMRKPEERANLLRPV